MLPIIVKLAKIHKQYFVFVGVTVGGGYRWSYKTVSLYALHTQARGQSAYGMLYLFLFMLYLVFSLRHTMLAHPEIYLAGV